MELGNLSYPAVGFCGEKLHFYSVCVADFQRYSPSEDGSPLEHGGEVVNITISEAKYLIKSGMIRDMKTEIGLRRFIDAFS